MVTERRPVREATRGILLLVGLAVGVVAVATAIAGVTVLVLG
jgi:hypothetical protein